ncbi:MAG: M23 family metallopeptidase, partial [Chloroflexota bacterium]|nr:M23 family metallopeptidase [Chloroflexota bacterium]
ASGELLGYVGDTGLSTGPHLHWEVWVNGIQVNPLEWIDQEIN